MENRRVSALLISTGLFGVLLTGLAVRYLPAADWFDTLAFAAANVVLAWYAIPLSRGTSITGAVSTGVAGMLALSPWGAFLAMVPNSIIESYRRKRPWPVLLFNCVIVSLPHLLGSWAYHGLADGWGLRNPGTPLVMLLAVVITYVVNYSVITWYLSWRDGVGFLTMLRELVEVEGLSTVGIRLMGLPIALAYETAGIWVLPVTVIILASYREAITVYSVRESLHRSARLDGLTQVGNRLAWEEALRLLVPGTQVLVVDLDGLKQVNDRFGHLKGDEVLRDLAQTLTDGAGPGARVFRFGGDEFAVLGRHEELLSQVDNSLQHFAARWSAQGVTVSASLGSARQGAEADTAEEAFRLADQRMYKCKLDRRDAAVG